MQNCSHEKIYKQNDQNGWGDDMKNHMFLKTPAESLALAGHITFNEKARKLILTSTNNLYRNFCSEVEDNLRASSKDPPSAGHLLAESWILKMVVYTRTYSRLFKC